MLRPHLGYRLLRLASRTNLESVPQFTEICVHVEAWRLDYELVKLCFGDVPPELVQPCCVALGRALELGQG